MLNTWRTGQGASASTGRASPATPAVHVISHPIPSPATYMSQLLLDHVLGGVQVMLVGHLPHVGPARHKLGGDAGIFLRQVETFRPMLKIMLRTLLVSFAENIKMEGLECGT